MAAVAGASWKKELMNTALFGVRGPLTNLITRTNLHLLLDPEITSDELLQRIEKVRCGFVLRNSSCDCSRAAREELRRKFPGEYVFLPIVDEARSMSLPELFREAMIKAIKVQITSLRDVRTMSKDVLEMLHSHLKFCRQRISQADGSEKKIWTKQLASTECNLAKMERKSCSKLTEEEEYEVVEAPDQQLQREIAQLTEWEKNPEVLLDLAAQDPDLAKSIFFVPFSELPQAVLRIHPTKSVS